MCSTNPQAMPAEGEMCFFQLLTDLFHFILWGFWGFGCFLVFWFCFFFKHERCTISGIHTSGEPAYTTVLNFLSICVYNSLLLNSCVLLLCPQSLFETPNPRRKIPVRAIGLLLRHMGLLHD